MHHNLDLVFSEDFSHGATIAEIFIKEGDIAGDGGAVAVGEIIEYEGCVTSGLELSDAVATDVTCASYDENVHGWERMIQVTIFKFQVCVL